MIKFNIYQDVIDRMYYAMLLGEFNNTDDLVRSQSNQDVILVETMEHTPGPWIINSDLLNEMICVQADQNKKWDNPTICNLYEDVTPEDSITAWNVYKLFENAEANARLIAAAPDMITLLQKYVTVLESDDKEVLTKLLQDTRDIIEKIKGS